MNKQQPKTVGWRVPPIVCQAMKRLAAKKYITLNEYVNRLLLQQDEIKEEIVRVERDALYIPPDTSPSAANKLDTTTSSPSTVSAGV